MREISLLGLPELIRLLQGVLVKEEKMNCIVCGKT
jgi:hypothetical protein